MIAVIFKWSALKIGIEIENIINFTFSAPQEVFTSPAQSKCEF